MDLEKVLGSVGRLRVIGNQCSKVSDAGVSTAIPKPRIHLSKTSALITEKVCVSVTGLKADQKVTLQTHVNQGNKSYGSCGHYVADTEGTINTFEHECHGGTYDGREPMGLFWSMKSIPGAPVRRILNTDVTRPVDVEISLYPDHVNFDDLSWTSPRQPLASCHFYQKFKSEGVTVIPVDEDGVVGTLFLPEGPGPFPAVIEMFGTIRVTPSHRSSLLASNGIASFNLLYVRPEDLATWYKKMEFTQFLKAFDWLSQHPSVDPKALGVVGSCVGAGYGSLIPWKRPNVRCFVSINSPARPEGPTQMVEGEVVECPGPVPFKRLKEVDGAISSKFLRSVEDNLQSLPYWRHGVKVLHIQSEDDQCINPDCLRQSHQDVPQEFQSNMEFVSYPGAGNILDLPFLPLCLNSYHHTLETMMLWGGEPKAHARAQEDSWERIVAFLKRNLIQTTLANERVPCEN